MQPLNSRTGQLLGALCVLGAASTQAMTGKTLIVTPHTETIDTVRQVALHASGRMAIIGEITQGLIAKDTSPQKLSYFSLYDAKGKVIQDFYTDLPGNTSLAGVTFDSAGNSYVLGDATDLPGGMRGNEVFVKQFKPDGASGWLRALALRHGETISGDRAADIAADGQGNLYVLFASVSLGLDRKPLNGGPVLVKLNSAGKPLWTHDLDRAAEPVALSVSPAGQVLVALNQVDKERTGWLYALNGEGKVLRQVALGKGERLEALSSSAEAVVVAGQKSSNAGAQQMAFLTNLTSELEPMWTGYWPQGISAFTAVAQTPGGEVYVGGRSDSGKNGQVLLRRYAAWGQALDTLVLDSPAQDNLHSLAVSAAGEVWVGGSAYQEGQWSGWLSGLSADLSRVTPFRLQNITLEPAINKFSPEARPIPSGMFKP